MVMYFASGLKDKGLGSRLIILTDFSENGCFIFSTPVLI